MNKHEKEFIEFRYKGRKFNLAQINTNSCIGGVRINFPNESYLYLNSKLSKRKKHLVKHCLITKRKLRKITYKTKECNLYE